MYFLVNGMDGTDAEAPARRQAARTAHLEGIKRMVADGTIIAAAAHVNDDDQMIGSTIIYNVESRAALDAILEQEPYIPGGVWAEIKISPVKIPPFLLK